MDHFMLDLETRGNSPGCQILSIGLIGFNPDADSMDRVFEDEGFYCVVSRDSCIDAMLHEDKDTMDWWRQQNENARQVLAHSEDASIAVPLDQALTDMTLYVGRHVSPRNAKIWGNGADFDNPIIGVAARMIGRKLPWQWGNRCYRTIKNLQEILGPAWAAPPVTRTGTYHNALDDAKTQALHMWDIVHRLRTALED